MGAKYAAPGRRRHLGGGRGNFKPPEKKRARRSPGRALKPGPEGPAVTRRVGASRPGRQGVASTNTATLRPGTLKVPLPAVKVAPWTRVSLPLASTGCRARLRPVSAATA